MHIVELLVSGFAIGILGSFHCVGMCGPLALALPIHQFSAIKKAMSILLYNLGRALTYSIMGLGFGLLGQGFTLFKIQQYTSIIAGVFILVVLLGSFFGQQQFPFIASFSIRIKNKLSQILKFNKSLTTYFSLGMVNGFLPCGLVYIAIASAVATNDILLSAEYMFAFGLGTMPMMALTMVFGKYISNSVKRKLNLITPFLIGIVAILLILRGLNLGIPYISPVHSAKHQSCCHH